MSGKSIGFHAFETFEHHNHNVDLPHPGGPGTSRAGLGLGLSDPRSALVSEFWRIYDERKRMGRPMIPCL